MHRICATAWGRRLPADGTSQWKRCRSIPPRALLGFPGAGRRRREKIVPPATPDGRQQALPKRPGRVSCAKRRPLTPFRIPRQGKGLVLQHPGVKAPSPRRPPWFSNILGSGAAPLSPGLSRTELFRPARAREFLNTQGASRAIQNLHRCGEGGPAGAGKLRAGAREGKGESAQPKIGNINEGVTDSYTPLHEQACTHEQEHARSAPPSAACGEVREEPGFRERSTRERNTRLRNHARMQTTPLNPRIRERGKSMLARAMG